MTDTHLEHLHKVYLISYTYGFYKSHRGILENI